MYATTWDVNGDADKQSLSAAAFPEIQPRPPADQDFGPHTLICRNPGTVSVWLGAEHVDGAPDDLTVYGWELLHGKQFRISLVHDQLWVAAKPGTTGKVTFLVVKE